MANRAETTLKEAADFLNRVQRMDQDGRGPNTSTPATARPLNPPQRTPPVVGYNPDGAPYAGTPINVQPWTRQDYQMALRDHVRVKEEAEQELGRTRRLLQEMELTLGVNQTALQRARVEVDVRKEMADVTRGIDAAEQKQSHRLKLQKYDGTDDFKDYLQQFNIIAKENEWNYHYKGVVLLSCLSSKARATVKELEDFHEVTVCLMQRYSQENQDMFAQELNVLVQKEGQSWEDLAEEAETLAERGYGESGLGTQQRLAVHAFVSAIKDDDIRKVVRQSHPLKVKEALAELKQVVVDRKLDKRSPVEAERRTLKTKAVQEVAEEKTGEAELLEQVAKLVRRMDQMDAKKSTARGGRTDRRQGPPRPVWNKDSIVCYHCKERGHYQYECPKKSEVRTGGAQKPSGNSQVQGGKSGAQ
jgi:hypothetical protein